MKILMVGGDFNENGGKPSKVIGRIFSSFTNTWMKCRFHGGIPDVIIQNGGNFEQLEGAAGAAKIWADIVLWFANVSNDVEDKYIADFKVFNKKCILVTSKRCIEKRYGFPDIIQRMLHIKSNLCLVITKGKVGRYCGQILDPLGNIFHVPGLHSGLSDDFDNIGFTLALRLNFLCTLTRVESHSQEVVKKCEVPNDKAFFKFVRESAAKFTRLIPSPTTVNRFLGNSSFRCARGFPSFRNEDSNIIYVSRRNIAKDHIHREEFVPVLGLFDRKVEYMGGKKPSVDTPVQCMLYNLFPNIRYMIHGHVYVKFTQDSSGEYSSSGWTCNVIPCGCLEEVSEIFSVIGDINVENFVVNLRGHGFIAGSDNIDFLRKLTFISRPLPEDQSIQTTECL